MAHPNKAEGIKGHNAKLRRMTRDYGAAGGPSQYRVARENQPKGNAASDHPEDNPGFGVDSAGATPRSDRPARRAAPGNATASYKRGGGVKGKRRAPGGATFNYGQSDMAASQQAMDKANQQNKPQGQGQQGGKGLIQGLLGSGSGSAPAGMDPSAKRGGRVRHRAMGGGLSAPGGSKSGRKGGKGKTNISININPAGAPPPVSGPPIGANPAMPPPMPPRPPMPPPGMGAPPGMPPGGPPGMPPGAGAPPGPLGQLALQQKAAGLLPRKRGGRVHHADEAADKKLVHQMVKPTALKERAKGGGVLKGKGAESGEGRLNRNRHMGHLGANRAHGGGVLKAAGAESGEGRLNRNRHMDHKLKPEAPSKIA